MFGVGALMGKATVLEAAPPGLMTTTVAVPGAVIKPAGTEAINCVALTNVVGNAEPFHCTIDPVTKPVPLTASVNADAPAVAEGGFKPVIPRGPIIAICAGCAPVSRFGHTRKGIKL
jgi:hypothetical protein